MPVGFRDDVAAIDNALRNLFDTSKRLNDQVNVHLASTDIVHDILEPVEKA